MENLIRIVNKLQDAFSQAGLEISLDLPQIAVVGGQSAGKSSVLENFIGRDFFPRGTGIVTRRPLVLQLFTNTKSNDEFGEFLHRKGTKFTNFDDIRGEIEEETSRTTIHNKGISPVPINLRIYSPNVLNLTLIDLPGLTKVPVGDQPADIEQQIRNMVLSFIRKESCLILAVTSATQDLATSDALQIAKEVDSDGLRTIGVLTKLDLMDDGTDCRDVLDNKLLPLRRGYVGVVNRGQKDIEGRKDIKSAQEAERKFFATHPSYRNIADRLGTQYLQKVLHRELGEHIRRCLPALRDKLKIKLGYLEKQIEELKYCKMMDDDDESSLARRRSKLVIKTVQQIREQFDRHILGCDTYDAIATNEISSGYKISRVYHDMFPVKIDKIVIEESELRREIEISIKNSAAIRIGIFTPDMVFRAVVRKQIDRFEEPAISCLRQVTTELVVAMENCLESIDESSSTLLRYPKLRLEIDRLVKSALDRNERLTREQVRSLVEVESSYINTNHEDFVGIRNDSSKIVDRNSQQAGMMNGGITRPTVAIDATLGRRLGNQVIKKGYLTIKPTASAPKEKGWFVLSADNLVWFRHDDELETMFIFTLDGLKLQENYKSFISNRSYTFSLYHEKSFNIYRDSKKVEFLCDSSSDLDSWKSSFARTGVFSIDNERKSSGHVSDRMSTDNLDMLNDDSNSIYQVNESGHNEWTNGGSEGQSTTDYRLEQVTKRTTMDAMLERQIETIRNMVDNYVKIITKKVKDHFPKIVTRYLIQETREFLNGYLLRSLLEKIDQVMEESPEELQRRQQLLKSYHAIKEALSTIDEVTIAVSSTKNSKLSAKKT